MALRAHYELRVDPSDASICIREGRTSHGADMLPAHFAGWQLTHDLLGDAAPRFAEFDGSRIRTELIPGLPLHEHYAAALRGEPVAALPWDALWAALSRVYDSSRAAPHNPKLIPEMAWATWFSIARLAEAKRYVARGAASHFSWSLAGGAALAAGKLAGGFTRPPAVVSDIDAASTKSLTLGDMHMANLVGNAGRIAFVDFSEVAHGSVALELAPLWMEWWLAQGLVHGDDGFTAGFTAMWRRYAGPEVNLVRMTSAFVERLFAWMLYAFHADHLGLHAAAAETATGRALERLDVLRPLLTRATRLDELVAAR